MMEKPQNSDFFLSQDAGKIEIIFLTPFPCFFAIFYGFKPKQHSQGVDKYGGIITKPSFPQIDPVFFEKSLEIIFRKYAGRCSAPNPSYK